MHLIPDVPVHARIPIGAGGESSNWIGSPKYYSSSSTDKSLGYNRHGIIIHTSSNTDYKCYDATCTACLDLTSYFKQDDLKIDIAKCSVCDTKFSLHYGTPINTVIEIYSLKEYPITRTGKMLIISYK